MSEPKNPNTIVIQNKYYPTGLTEGQVWNHYQKYKNDILKHINRRNVLIFLATDVNNLIVRRNESGSNKILLNQFNYDTVISGRSISLSVEMPKSSGYQFIDIDAHDINAPESQLKEAVTDIINYYKRVDTPLHKGLGINHIRQNIRGVKVTNSASGYHVYAYIYQNYGIDYLKQLLKADLTYLFGDKYRIDGKGDPDSVNIDLSQMRVGGSHTIPNSLNRNGTMCKDLSTKDWIKFNRKDSVIK